MTYMGMNKKDWIVYIVIGFSFILGWEWSAYTVHKDMSQIGTQLQCTQSGDVQK